MITSFASKQNKMIFSGRILPKLPKDFIGESTKKVTLLTEKELQLGFKKIEETMKKLDRGGPVVQTAFATTTYMEHFNQESSDEEEDSDEEPDNEEPDEAKNKKKNTNPALQLRQAK